jgi:Transposase DDE domain
MMALQRLILFKWAFCVTLCCKTNNYMETPSKSPSKYSYKIKNWKNYNNSLKKRGQISLWLNSKLLSMWEELDVRKIEVGEQIYPDVIVEFCWAAFRLIIKNIYHLPLRQTTGLRVSAPFEDLLALQGFVAYCIPNYSTLCRRAKQ